MKEVIGSPKFIAHRSQSHLLRKITSLSTNYVPLSIFIHPLQNSCIIVFWSSLYTRNYAFLPSEDDSQPQDVRFDNLFIHSNVNRN